MREACLAAALAVFAIGSASAHDLYTPPRTPYPLPQGVPTMVVGKVPQRVATLGYGWVHGRRVLYDRATLNIVYVLQP